MPLEEESLPPPPKKGMLGFGKAQLPPGPDLSGVTGDINSLSRRLKLLEEGITNLRRFFQVTEENVIAKNKHYSAELKTINSDISEMRKEIQEVKDKLMLVIRELQSVARKEEVRVLEKYINLWNPVKFISQNEIEGIINEVIDKREKDNKKE
ncbi:MAG TPA: hypothetical protein VJJ52_07810 [Candidatus Nanoarchaeia archaeon]|nr:hypothetical protein [Candidatus Nanoarchaeia archaeon]